MDEPTYFSLPGVSGNYFRCSPYQSTLSVTSCAGMYRAEKGRQNGRHPHCNGCSVGALHAGEAAPVESDYLGSKICPRCRGDAPRIVKGVCVSCINRQYEVERGCNAKGSAPVRLKPLFPMSVSYVSQGQEQTTSFPRVADRVEAVLRVLRTQPGDVEFGWSSSAPTMPQIPLF